MFFLYLTGYHTNVFNPNACPVPLVFCPKSNSRSIQRLPLPRTSPTPDLCRSSSCVGRTASTTRSVVSAAPPSLTGPRPIPPSSPASTCWAGRLSRVSLLRQNFQFFNIFCGILSRFLNFLRIFFRFFKIEFSDCGPRGHLGIERVPKF